jgi:hypothetical protein
MKPVLLNLFYPGAIDPGLNIYGEGNPMNGLLLLGAYGAATIFSSSSSLSSSSAFSCDYSFSRLLFSTMASFLIILLGGIIFFMASSKSYFFLLAVYCCCDDVESDLSGKGLKGS